MLCVIAKIDEHAKVKLSEIAALVNEFGIEPKRIHGHFTLVTYIGDDEAGFIEKCKDVLTYVRSFSVLYEQIKVLPASSIVVASPKITPQLISLHHMLSAVEPSGLNEWTSDKCWEAHTTLVYQPQTDLYAIANRMRQNFAPFQASVSCIEFSQVLDDGYSILETYPLPL